MADQNQLDPTTQGYVKQYLDQGKSPQEIRDALSSQPGWTPELLERYVPLGTIPAATGANRDTTDKSVDAIGRFFGKLGENAKGIWQGASQTGEALLQSLNGRNPSQQSQGLSTLKQMYVDPQVEEARKAQADPNFLSGMVHGAASAVPLVGPPIMNAAHEVTHGDPAGGFADILTLLGMQHGGDLMSKLREGSLVDGGRSVYKAGLPLDRENLSPTSQDVVGNRMFQEGIRGKRGVKAGPELDRLQGLIDEGLRSVNDRARNYQGGPMMTMETLGPVEKAIQDRLMGPGPKQAAPLEAHLADYVENQTGMSRDVKSFPSDADPRQYIQRVIGIDPGQDMETWLKINRAFNAIVPDKKAMASAANSMEGSPGESMFNRLQQGGIRDAIKSRDPGLAELNSQVSQAIHVHKALSELARENPSKITQILPLVAGGAAGGILHTLGIPMGSPALETMAPVAGTAIATYVIRQALRDPAILMRVGLGLKNMGEASTAKALFQLAGHSPSLAFAGQHPITVQGQSQP